MDNLLLKYFDVAVYAFIPILKSTYSLLTGTHNLSSDIVEIPNFYLF